MASLVLWCEELRKAAMRLVRRTGSGQKLS